MKFLFMALSVSMIYSSAFGQDSIQNSSGFIGYVFTQTGNLLFQADTPSSDYLFEGDYGISYKNVNLENTNTISLGFQLKQKLFLVSNISISSDNFSSHPRGLEKLKTEISVTSYTPYIGLRRYFELREKIFPYLEIGYSKRFTTVESEKYFDEEEKGEFEESIEDILSHRRWNLEIGVDYNIYEYFSIGLSTIIYHELRSGKAIKYGGIEGETLYDFNRTRVGQIYNLKITIHY